MVMSTSEIKLSHALIASMKTEVGSETHSVTQSSQPVTLNK